MRTGMSINQTVMIRKTMECFCPHPKGPDGLHLCRVSEGMTHDYCCQPDPNNPKWEHCSCRIQKPDEEHVL